MSPPEIIANWEAFLWALYKLGGSDQFVDIEEVSLKCFEIAPARFGWRTRPDLPDYKKCAKALQEAERRRPPMLVKSGDTFARQLSADGQQWIAMSKKRLSAILETDLHVPEPKRRPSSRLLSEIESSEPFREWLRTRQVTGEKWRVADMLRCSPDSSPTTWKDRLESAKGVAYSAERTDLLDFLRAIPAAHPDWFGGPRNEA
jgi:hypothetical protein